VPEGQDFTANLNPHSLEIVSGGKLEPSLATPRRASRFQFERLGYFCVDLDSKPGKLVFNRTVRGVGQGFVGQNLAMNTDEQAKF
jgi:glutaminyl-tRNA synthetase